MAYLPADGLGSNWAGGRGFIEQSDFVDERVTAKPNRHHRLQLTLQKNGICKERKIQGKIKLNLQEKDIARK